MITLFWFVVFIISIQWLLSVYREEARDKIEN